MNIFVGNLNPLTTESQLQNLFAEYGNVLSVKIVTDNYTSQSRGFAFIEMPEKAEAEKAIEKLNNSCLTLQFIVVNEAKPRTTERRDNYWDKGYKKRV